MTDAKDVFDKLAKLSITEDPELAAILKKREEMEKKEADFAAALKALCDEYFEEMPVRQAANVVSKVMGMLDNKPLDIGSEGPSCMERATALHMGQKVKEYYPAFSEVYAFLVEKGFTEDNPWEYAIDGYAFYVPTEPAEFSESLIFQFGRRSRNYLLFLSKDVRNRYTLHIRRVFDDLDEEDRYDRFLDIKEGGVDVAVRRLESLSELTDNVNENRYVRQPNFAWYKKNNFNLPYKDNRDPGYVLSLGGHMQLEYIESCMGSYYAILNAFSWFGILYDSVRYYDEDE